MKQFKELLIERRACKEAREWAQDMPIEEVVQTCHRGDWLLWLAKKVDIDFRKLTLAKAHCANTVRHLMKDERSTNAIDVAIMYGNGGADDEQLKAAAYAADAAYAAAAYVAADATAAYAAAAATAAYAAAAAAYATDAAYAAAAYATAAYAAAAAAYAARSKNRQQTADICREYIGQLIIDKVNEILSK